MRVEIDAVSERLDDGNDTGLEDHPRHGLKIEKKRPDGTAAELSQELALEFEEYPEHLRNREDHLAVRDIQEKLLVHPLSPLLQPLGVARRAESPRAAGKHQKMFGPAARTADPGEPTAGITAVKIALDDVLDDRTEIAVRFLETLLVLRDEALTK